MEKTVILKKATIEDAETLRNSQVIAFLNDNKNKPQGANMGLPPGCDSLTWISQRIEANHVYKIMFGEILIGGFIIFDYGNKKEIGRVWIDPAYQNNGLGQLAFEILFRQSPANTVWVLETPDWAIRNQHFYRKVGFEKIGETEFNPHCGWREFKYKQLR